MYSIADSHLNKRCSYPNDLIGNTLRQIKITNGFHVSSPVLVVFRRNVGLHALQRRNWCPELVDEVFDPVGKWVFGQALQGCDELLVLKPGNILLGTDMLSFTFLGYSALPESLYKSNKARVELIDHCSRNTYRPSPSRSG